MTIFGQNDKLGQNEKFGSKWQIWVIFPNESRDLYLQKEISAFNDLKLLIIEF